MGGVEDDMHDEEEEEEDEKNEAIWGRNKNMYYSADNVDYECIQGLPEGALRRIILIASGGAFRDLPVEKLKEVKVADALKHPNWNMGKKIIVDSATLFNKGLEVIEAHYLFGAEYDDIEIVIHPQSIIHFMVETQILLFWLGWDGLICVYQFFTHYHGRTEYIALRLHGRGSIFASRVCRRRLPEIGASEALSRRRCSPHPKPSPLFPLDLSAAFIKPDFRYIDFCRKREVLPNDAIVSSFSKAKLQKSCFERSILQVLLDLLMDVDVPPLIETFSLMGSYEIDAIDIINESPCVLKRENVMSLINGSETLLLYSVSDPLLIRDGSETDYNNFVSDPLLIKDGSEIESNNSVSDPLLIREGSETEYNNYVSDPLLIRDGSETEFCISSLIHL
ncbi:hypothetical protein Scep_012450 [Stephania cephalantha]|uniref:1-deoxy-D-xylulose-5-phosphate reductoisomerase n=1 Tax=Stephania cephalantha TaxID=152367 RepID=A0AAP0P6H2_9MAGN